MAKPDCYQRVTIGYFHGTLTGLTMVGLSEKHFLDIVEELAYVTLEEFSSVTAVCSRYVYRCSTRPISRILLSIELSMQSDGK